MLDFADGGVSKKASQWFQAAQIAVSQVEPEEEGGSRVEYAKEGEVPTCIQALFQEGLFKEGTRNAALQQAVFMLKQLGRSQADVLGACQVWTRAIPERLTGTPLGERLSLAKQSVEWGFTKQTNPRCDKIKDLGAPCVGLGACHAVTSHQLPPEDLGKIRTYTLAELLDASLYGKEVDFEGMPIAVEQVPQTIPATVKVVCKKSAEVCGSCRLFNRKEDKQEFAISGEAALRYSTAPDRAKWPFYVREKLGAPKECQAAIVFDKYQTALTALIQPPTGQATRENQILVLGNLLDSGKPYMFRGETYPHPKSFKTIHVVTKAAQSDTHSSFVFTPEVYEKLKVFQADGSDPDAVREKIDDIFDEWEEVHRIRGRQLQAIMMVMPWFSVMGFNMHGKAVRKGWLDVLAYGDTGQGKSEIAQCMLDFFGAGQMTSGENMSSAGLLMGVDKLDNRNIVRKGVLPRNDMGMVIIDEFGAVPDELIGSLSSVRSSGKAQMNKIAHSEVTARTRLLMLANPIWQRSRASTSMDRVNYGIQHCMSLMRNPEDVRRLDYCIGFKKQRFIEDQINRSGGCESELGNTYNQGSSSLLVRFAWSRSLDHVQFTKRAQEECLRFGRELPGDFSQSIPLLDPGDSRLKVGRVGAAVAILTGSFGDDGRVSVRAAHIAAARRLITELYCSLDLQYDSYTAMDPEKILLNHGMFLTIATAVMRAGTDIYSDESTISKWQEIVELFLHQITVHLNEIHPATGALQPSNVIQILTRHKLLQKHQGTNSHGLTPRGKKVFKLMQRYVLQEKNPPNQMPETWFLEWEDKA